MDVHLRRRVAFATVLTLVAVPVYLVLGRDGAESSSSAAAVSDTTAAPDGAPSTVAFTLPPTTMAGPIFLDDSNVIVPPAVIDVVRPEPTTDNRLEGRASFQRFETTTDERLCTSYAIGNGALLTVTNIANGLSVTCRNRWGTPLASGVDLVLDTDLYTRIADLADAPIFVRITW
jgi:hypothetical protein